MKINTTKLGLMFFLANRTKVNDLEVAAKYYGGATLNLETNEMFSNIPGGEFIEVFNKNTISIFVPNTVNINEMTDNTKQVKEVVGRLYKRYNKISDLSEAKGSWYSEELNKVVYDDITMVTINLEKISVKDVQFFLQLGKYIKSEMKQESVSVLVNNSLCLV